ncbi:hypothetical protein [Niallia taxi]|uniref:hypothetical protein n=1 Tax=Niallia taxi TaxID=2499688 RepID=UPI003D2B5BED
MGFLKGLGEGAGWLVGNVTGGLIKGVGELTNSEFIKEVGDGVKHSTEFAGKQIGNVAEGVWNVGSGLITKDDYKIDQGLDDLGDGIGNTAKAIGHGIPTTVSNIGDVAGGLIDGDSNRALEGAKHLGKTALIATLSVSVLDAADIVDISGNEGGVDGGSNFNADPTDKLLVGDNVEDNIDYVQEDNPNSHSVEPHWRTLSDGREIWVDGDGDSSVNRSVEEGGGWTQSNPNYRIPTDKA